MTTTNYSGDDNNDYGRCNYDYDDHYDYYDYAGGGYGIKYYSDD